jgi:hypothetical protein
VTHHNIELSAYTVTAKRFTASELASEFAGKLTHDQAQALGFHMGIKGLVSTGQNWQRANVEWPGSESMVSDDGYIIIDGGEETGVNFEMIGGAVELGIGVSFYVMDPSELH